MKGRLYWEAGMDICILSFTTFVENLDITVRIMTGTFGTVVAILTGFRILQRIRQGRDEAAITKITRKRLEYELKQYEQSNRNSQEVPEQQRADGEPIH